MIHCFSWSWEWPGRDCDTTHLCNFEPKFDDRTFHVNKTEETIQTSIVTFKRGCHCLDLVRMVVISTIKGTTTTSTTIDESITGHLVTSAIVIKRARQWNAWIYPACKKEELGTQWSSDQWNMVRSDANTKAISDLQTEALQSIIDKFKPTEGKVNSLHITTNDANKTLAILDSKHMKLYSKSRV